ncbi:MAG: hypothetical protein LBQ60_16080 [Bacteroidales bacterium]|nr:hypothetical protein [Bacteroidales bacterium]
MPVSDNINRIQVLSGDKMVITESGYLEVFAYNNAQTPVFFDNIELRHTSGPVLEENHYYPFGMLMDMSYMPLAVNERNFYKYGRKELQTEHNLNWGDHENRMSDYTAGRWWVVDPLAEDYYDWSPYNYCFNNPLLFVDPDGRGPFKKFEFNGSAWDYLKSIPNFATNLVNGLIDGAVGLLKGGAATVSVIYHEGLSGYGSALASEAKGMANGVAQFVEGEINYHSTTPIGEQFKNAFSPQSIETALTIAVPVITGTAAANLTKGATTNVAKGAAKNTVAETTSAAKGEGFGSMMEASEAARYTKFWQNYAPKQVTPGTTRLDWLRQSGRTKQIESSRVIYDNFGRQIYRVDFSNHMRPLNHSIPHLHQYQFGPMSSFGKESVFNFFGK